jgi:hypothetical protein
MCTCTANSGHIPPTIQRYIPINVQRNDSISSEDGSWVAAWLEFFFRSSGRVAKASWKKNKNSDNVELGWKWSFRIGGSG